MKVKQLIANPTKWTQGAYARDVEGDGVPITHPEATCFCLLGAINFCYPRPRAGQIIRQMEKEVAPQLLTEWNDSHTYEEVLALVERYDI